MKIISPEFVIHGLFVSTFQGTACKIPGFQWNTYARCLSIQFKVKNTTHRLEQIRYYITPIR